MAFVEHVQNQVLWWYVRLSLLMSAACSSLRSLVVLVTKEGLILLENEERNKMEETTAVFEKFCSLMKEVLYKKASLCCSFSLGNILVLYEKSVASGSVNPGPVPQQ